MVVHTSVVRIILTLSSLFFHLARLPRRRVKETRLLRAAVPLWKECITRDYHQAGHVLTPPPPTPHKITQAFTYIHTYRRERGKSAEVHRCCWVVGLGLVYLSVCVLSSLLSLWLGRVDLAWLGLDWRLNFPYHNLSVFNITGVLCLLSWSSCQLPPEYTYYKYIVEETNGS